MSDAAEFDIKTLNDEELIERWNMLNKKIVWANRFGSMSMVQQLLIFKNQVEFEQRERLIEKTTRNIIGNPLAIVETDPDLSAEHKAKIDAIKEEKAKQTTRPRISITSRAGIRERLQATSVPTDDTKKDDSDGQ